MIPYSDVLNSVQIVHPTQGRSQLTNAKTNANLPTLTLTGTLCQCLVFLVIGLANAIIKMIHLIHIIEDAF